MLFLLTYSAAIYAVVISVTTAADVSIVVIVVAIKFGI